ncbi:hypothetical protein NW759_013501 [Fusarium solani]|nr:hypothetical protein NW759_013501 [Fusarium solani]
MAQTVTAQGTEHLDKLTKDASHAEHQVPTGPPEPSFGLAQWKDNLRAFKTNKKTTLWCVMIMSLLINFGFDAIISGQALAFQAFREDYGRYYAPADDYVISAMWQSLWTVPGSQSPMWYMMKEREEDARKAIVRLHGDLSAERVEEMVEELRHNINVANQGPHEVEKVRWLEIFQGGNLKHTALLTTIYTLHHCSGMPFVISYQTYFFQLSGVSDAFAISLGAFALMLAGNIGALILPNFVGQRKVMIYGATLLIIWDLIIGTVGFAGTDNKPAVTASVAFVASWAFFYQLTIGTIGFVVAPELPSQRLRAKTQSFGTIVSNIIGWAIAFSIPYLFNPDEANLGARLLIIFVGLSIPLTLYLWFFLPETKNRTLSELEELY